MNEISKRLAERIRETESCLGLDWRSSWSAIEAAPSGLITVSASVPAVAAALRDFEPGGRDATAGGPMVRVESPGETSSRLFTTASVADIRREPGHASELLTQAIMGESLVPIVRRGDWYLVVLQGGYHGWVRSWHVRETTADAIEEWRGRATKRVAAAVAYVRSEPSVRSLPVSDVTAGTWVVPGPVEAGWREVEIPGDRRGFVEESALEDPPAGPPSRREIVSRAARFTGIPYLWGGTSAKAFDCSGFVLRIYAAEGIDLPRDADRQAAAVRRPPPDGIEEARPADLIFFGEESGVTHVAICLGGMRFIHAFGDVRVNSLRPEDTDFEEKLARCLLYAGVPPGLD